MEKEKYKTSLVKLIFIGTVGLIAFFSLAFIGLSINFPIKWNLALVFIIAILFLLFGLFLARSKKYTEAKFILVLIPSYAVFFVSLLSKTDGILDNVLVYLAHRFFTLTYLIAPVIFFGLEDKRKMLISFLLLAPVAIFFDFVHEFFGVNLANLSFDPSYYRFFNFMVILIYGFGITSVLLFQKTAIAFKMKILSQAEKIGLQEKELRSTLLDLDKSIKHARYIQRTLLPDQATLNSFFEDIASLYIPKDQVSGDFYFAQRSGDGVFFGVGDCTGHGVPGAFIANMSIQSIMLLLKRQKDILLPDILLTKLREIALERVVNVDSYLSDSMDAGACMYDAEKEVLYFSGGFINLILIRNYKELIEYKGTKCPIGSYPVNLPFELHSIKIEKNDVIYITSDGYFDQFGYDLKSKSGKSTKFKRTRFKEFLISISHLRAQEQVKLLEERFYSWKGDEEQTDDVTVLVNKF